jgi:tetratricopeptide (TPR) repeat protein
VWDTQGGYPLTDVLVHDLTVRSVAFDRAGERFITAGDDGVARIWDADTGREIPPHFPIRHTAALTWADFSPDGEYVLTTSLDGTAQMWNSNSGQRRFARPIEHAQGVLSGAFSPDGRHFATASADDSARIYEISGNGRQPDLRATIRFHTADVTHVAFSQQDGKYLVTSSVDQAARVWDLQGRPMTPAINHDQALSSARFSPDNQVLATVSRDRRVWLWDLSSHLASDGDDDFETDRAWTNLPVQLIAPPLNHLGQVRTAAFGNDGGTLMTGSDDNMLQVTSWYLPEIPLDREQLEQYGVALTGQDATQPGTFTPVGCQALKTAWERIEEQSSYDVPFGLNPDILSRSIEEWHLQQISRAELVGTPDTAVGHLNELLLTDPQNASLLGRRAQAYFTWARQAQYDRSKLQHALQDYLAASQIDGANPANYSYFERRGEIHRAYANQVVSNDSPADPPASELWSAAIGDFTRAIELHPDRWWPYYMRGRTYAELLDWEHARADFDQATKLGARQDYVWYFLAMISLLQENEPAYQETVSAMTKIFSDTKSPQIANIVIWTSTLGENTFQHMNMMTVLADAARKLSLADRSFYLNTLAAAAFRAAEQSQLSGDSASARGQFEDALRLFEEAVQVRSSEGPATANPDTRIAPVGILQRALIYHALEQDTLAEEWLKKAEEWSMSVEQGDQSAAWITRAEFQILYREATRKIRSNP